MDIVLQGNEACAKAALHSGCRFFAGYPITPSTEIIETLAKEMVENNGVFIQMEDEIASACAVIGARWGGKRSMTATSGPGYTLMQEAIGYAAVTETPTVIVNVQRGGPSTGQPTMSSQQDVYQARYGSHGDYEIIAYAPSSVQEMFDYTKKAFLMSEKYRTPVIILADEIVGHMREKVKVGEDEVKFDFSKVNSSSPRSDFYTGENTLVEGQLHDREGRRIGHLATQSGEFIEAINNKIKDNIDDIVDIDTYYIEDADIVFVTYGSVARSALKAVELARGIRDERPGAKLNLVRDIFKKGTKAFNSKYRNLKVGLIKINSVWPFPEEQLKRLTKDVSMVVVPEMNIGKYYREIERALPGKTIVSQPKCGGDIHTPNEMLDAILREVNIYEQAL